MLKFFTDKSWKAFKDEIKESLSNKNNNNQFDPLTIMPVGYIYISANPTSPEELFGGKWEQLADNRYLRLANDFNTGGSNTWSGEHTHTGPSHTHTYSHTHQGPSHTHTYSHTHKGPSHTHTGPSHTHALSSGMDLAFPIR